MGRKDNPRLLELTYPGMFLREEESAAWPGPEYPGGRSARHPGSGRRGPT